MVNFWVVLLLPEYHIGVNFFSFCCFFLFFCIFVAYNLKKTIEFMKKKLLGIQVMPISPMVRAWAVFVSVFDLEKPEGQQSASCSVQTLLDELVRRSSAEDALCEKLKRGILLPDELHDVPFLSYGSLYSLVNILGVYGEISLTPAAAGGMLIEVVFDSDSLDLFNSLCDVQ